MIWAARLPPITILRSTRPDEALAYTQVLVNVGSGATEILPNSPNWVQSVQFVARTFGDRALIGADTVSCPEDADLMVATGGKLVVMPNTHAPVIRTATQAGLVACTGCMTATETFAVFDADVQALKISPAGALDPGYTYALKTVLPVGVSVLAVDDITPENLADHLVAGCIGAGLDGDLYRPGQPVGRAVERACVFVTVYHNTQSDRT